MTPDAGDRLEEMMKRYQHGDAAAFEEIYRRTVGSLEAYLRHWTGGAPVDDLAQETYLQVIRARRAYRPEIPLLPWLLAIARHVVLRERRTHARRWGREVAMESHLRAAPGSPAAHRASRVALDPPLAP